MYVHAESGYSGCTEDRELDLELRLFIIQLLYSNACHLLTWQMFSFLLLPESIVIDLKSPGLFIDIDG